MVSGANSAAATGWAESGLAMSATSVAKSNVAARVRVGKSGLRAICVGGHLTPDHDSWSMAASAPRPGTFVPTGLREHAECQGLDRREYRVSAVRPVP